MADENIFQALITAVDRATGPIRAIAAAMRAAAGEEAHFHVKGVAEAKLHGAALTAAGAPVSAVAAALRAAGAGEQVFHKKGTIEAAEHARGFGLITDHVKLLRDHVGSLHDSITDLGSGMSELLPMFAGLGAASSLAGLFELSHSAFEASSELESAAVEAGVTARELAALRLQGETVHVTAEQLTTALGRLGTVMGHPTKDAAAVFHRFGIELRDAGGHARTAAEILPELADAFQKTTDVAGRQYAARTLFGRGGLELLPLLVQGAAGMKKWSEESAKVDFVPEGAQKEQLEQYEDAWITLTHAVEGFKDAVGADLAPELTKLLSSFKDWITANRDWLALKITDQVHDLVAAVKAIDWNKAAAELKQATAPARALADALGPLPTAIGAVTLVLGAPFIAAITTAIRDMTALTLWSGRAAVAIGTSLVAAFKDAGLAMDVFDRRFTASRIGQVVNVLATIAESMGPKQVDLNDQQRALVQSWKLPPGSHLTPAQTKQLGALATPAPTGWQTLKDKFGTLFGTPQASPLPAPPLLGGEPAPPVPPGGGSAGLAGLLTPRAAPAATRAAPSDGRVKVQIDINNLPPGSKVQTSSSGAAVAHETNVGYADPIAYGY